MALAAIERRITSGPGTPPALSPADLTELFAEFNELTARLQETHETLSGEAARLEGELRIANEQLRRSRELAALGEMAAGIAHEVRNPLGSIRLYASMLEQDLGDRPEQRRIATRIGEAVRGLDHIVGDVLAFARELKLRAAPVDPWDLLERAADACRAECERSSADIALRRVAGAPASVVCDAGLMHQALLNVVRNAAEAIADSARAGRRGMIELSVRRRTVRVEGGKPAPMAALAVRDNGPGVPDDVKRRMFNPFFTTRAAGTGLGLAIVHRIMDAHGGRVGVTNHGEGGAVVELMLPLDGPRAGAADGTESQGGGR